MCIRDRLYALHGALFARIAIHIRMICHGTGEHGALERNCSAQVVGFQRLGDFVVQPDATVHGNVFKAHSAAAAHKIMLRAGDFPLALLFGKLLFRAINHVGANVAAKKPVGNVQTAHFRYAVSAAYENVRQQPLALEVLFKLITRLRLCYGKGNHLLRLYAAFDAVGQDCGAAAVWAFNGGGGVFGHKLRAAVLANIGPNAFFHLLKAFLRAFKGDLLTALGRIQHFKRFRFKGVAAGGAFQLAGCAVKCQRATTAWAVVTGCTHQVSLSFHNPVQNSFLFKALFQSCLGCSFARGWSQYLQRSAPPFRARFFAPQFEQTHCA